MVEALRIYKRLQKELEKAKQEKVREQLLKEQQLAKVRKEGLLQEAADWHKAQQLYRYIEHLHHELMSKGLAEKDEYVGV